MKLSTKSFIIINILCLVPALGGCGLAAQAREADELLIVQTMGLDYAPEGVALSLATAGDDPTRLESRGPSVTAAIERARAGTSEEELFCAHLGHLLIGEEAAREGLGPLLDYVCRAGELRLSVPVYVLRGAKAGDAVLRAGDGSFSVSDALDSVEADLRRRGDGQRTEAAALLRDLMRRGSALVCAVELLPSAQQEQEGDAPLTLVPAGYAVLRDGRLCAFLGREQAVGVGLLRSRSGPCEIEVRDAEGGRVTLSLTGGSCALEPDWAADGSLRSLGFHLRAEALLAERGTGEAAMNELQIALERVLAGRVREVLRLSKEQGADFLDLEGQLERLAPRRMREVDFAALWPALPVTVTVSARLSGTGDLEDAP